MGPASTPHAEDRHQSPTPKHQVLERARWSASIAASRQVSLYTTLVLYLLSLLRHGFLPAFFTLLVVFNGLSLSKVHTSYIHRQVSQDSWGSGGGSVSIHTYLHKRQHTQKQ